MMRQLFWLVSGDRQMLEATQLLHSTVANVARRAGLFDADKCEPFHEGDDVERAWRRWAVYESRKRWDLLITE